MHIGTSINTAIFATSQPIMEKTKIAKLQLKRAMDVSQLQCLRGAVNKLLCEQDGGWEANLLFHNHEASRLRYGYPLV